MCPEWSVLVSEQELSAVRDAPASPVALSGVQADAVAMVEASGGQIAKVARELNIYEVVAGELGDQSP